MLVALAASTGSVFESIVIFVNNACTSSPTVVKILKFQGNSRVKSHKNAVILKFSKVKKVL